MSDFRSSDDRRSDGREAARGADEAIRLGPCSPAYSSTGRGAGGTSSNSQYGSFI